MTWQLTAVEGSSRQLKSKGVQAGGESSSVKQMYVIT
jgi:hypothetical protein